MRLWSLNPSHLDRQGLSALWREGLLAQKVLAGETVGYRHHPQLERFRATADPMAAIATYLAAVADEAAARGYRFDRDRIRTEPTGVRLPVTEGQVAYEWHHLLAKLKARSPKTYETAVASRPQLHPMFDEVPGEIEPWERPVSERDQ